MTRLAEAFHVTHTEATLEARGVFQVARRLASAVKGELGEALTCELDELVLTYTETLQARDGYVDEETYGAALEDAKNARADEETAIEEKDKAEERLEELLDAAKETPEVVLSRLTIEVEKVEKMRAECQKMAERVKALQERIEYADKLTAEARQEETKAYEARNAAVIRMASWSEDRSASQTAGFYRERCEAAKQELAAYQADVSRILDNEYKSAGKSKVKRGLLDSIEHCLRNAKAMRADERSRKS